MPESVQNWVETEDYLKCQQVQDDIMLAYEDDFSKYEGRTPTDVAPPDAPQRGAADRREIRV